MTRYIGTPDSVVAGNPGFLNNGILQAIATGQINAGELCTLFESGVVRRTDPSLPWSAINQNSPFMTVITEQHEVENIILTGMLHRCIGHPRRLLSDIYVIPILTSSGIGFHLRSSTGLEITNVVIAAADTCQSEACVQMLNTGNFVLFWQTSATLKFQIFTPFGVAVSSIISVSTVLLTSGLTPWFGFCQLQNGNFVVAWGTTGGALVAQIYSPIGAQVGSQIGIDSYSAQHIFCCECTNGDFVVNAWDVTHSRFKVYRFHNNGTPAWGPITPSSTATLWAQPDAQRMHHRDNRLFELVINATSNYNIAIVLPDTDNYSKVWVLKDTDGSVVQKVDIGAAYHDTGVANPIVLTPAGFAVCHALNGQPNTYVSFFDMNGNSINRNVLVDNNANVFPPGSTPTVNLYGHWAGSGVAITRYAFYLGQVEGILFSCDHRGGLIGSPYFFQPIGADDMGHCMPHGYKDGRIFIAWFSLNVTRLKITHQKIGRSSVIGVAQAAAADGQPVTINSQGYFALPATQIFGPGQAFDQRLAPVPGCRGVVGGQAAVLFGWVGPVGPPIIAPAGSTVQAPDPTGVIITTATAGVAPSVAGGGNARTSVNAGISGAALLAQVQAKH